MGFTSKERDSVEKACDQNDSRGSCLYCSISKCLSSVKTVQTNSK